jgi:hypothetical protein
VDDLLFDELKRREEQKRERCWDPAERWRIIQEMITYVESLPSVRRNTPARCLELQRAILASMGDVGGK